LFSVVLVIVNVYIFVAQKRKCKIELHGYTVHQRYRTIYSPTNAHNVKNVELLKQFKIKEAAPTCFGLRGNHHQGATAST